MKYLDSAKYLIVTVILINLSFYMMASFGDSKMIVSQQMDNEISLIPREGFTRGSLEISESQKIINWRNNKNSVHWKFVCSQAGTYEVRINHNRVSKEIPISISITGQKFDQLLRNKTTQTIVGQLDLNAEVHGLALFAEDIPKKSKLPEISSITLIKIK
jgi:hypothetical protein